MKRPLGGSPLQGFKKRNGNSLPTSAVSNISAEVSLRMHLVLMASSIARQSALLDRRPGARPPGTTLWKMCREVKTGNNVVQFSSSFCWSATRLLSSPIEN